VQTPRSRSCPLVWLGVVCVALGVAARVGQVNAVANIGLLPTPLPFAVETHPLELSPSLFAHERPIANASVSFAPTGATQTTLGDIPFPTGAWWTNLVLDKGDNPVSTMPYMFKIEGGKLKVGYPFRVVLPRIIQNGFVSEIIVTGNAKSRWQQQVVGFDAFGVALQFTAPQQPDAGSFTTYLVRGSPYVTTEFNNAVPVIESSDGIKIQRLKRLDQTMVDMKGKPLQFAVYALMNSNGHLWYVFGSDQTLELTLQGGKVQASTKFTGVIRIALALTVDAAPLLLESAPVYAVGGDVKYEVDTANQVATVEFAWKTKTFPGVTTNASKLLMLALPHHNDTLVPNSVMLVDDLRYTAIRGIMVGVLGDVWKMEEPLPEIEWSYPTNQGLFNTTDDADKIKREEMAKTATAMIAESLRQDILTFQHLAVDSYGFGKQMGRETRLLLIADAMGQKEAFNHQLQKIKTEIEPWLSATNGDALVYDERYGGLVTKNGMRDQNADFGNGYYNDHHVSICHRRKDLIAIWYGSD
jgi:endo-1,3(4)-beta-glucanase